MYKPGLSAVHLFDGVLVVTVAVDDVVVAAAALVLLVVLKQDLSTQVWP